MTKGYLYYIDNIFTVDKYEINDQNLLIDGLYLKHTSKLIEFHIPENNKNKVISGYITKINPVIIQINQIEIFNYEDFDINEWVGILQQPYYKLANGKNIDLDVWMKLKQSIGKTLTTKSFETKKENPIQLPKKIEEVNKPIFDDARILKID